MAIICLCKAWRAEREGGGWAIVLGMGRSRGGKG